MGRLTAHKVNRNPLNAPAKPSAQALFDKGRTPSLQHLPGGQQIQRQFQYDAGGNLSGVADSLRGSTRYAYDALSRIRGAQSGPKGDHRELFAFDPAGNLLNPNQGGAQSSGGVGDGAKVHTNRLAVYQDLRFTYDVHGNTTQRLVGWHTEQLYRYSPEHQIVAVTVKRYQDKPEQNPQAAVTTQTTQTTRYRYDALGRRIDKSDTFARTRFVYDGDLLTAEIRGSRLSEYLYEPDSFVPLAKMESVPANDASVLKLVVATTGHVEPSLQKTKSFELYYYQCDQIGAPQELTDEQGRIVWAASYKVWGETQPLECLKTGTDGASVAVFSSNSRPLGLAQASDAQALNLVEQPLRFQGQYFDQETGLHYNRFRYYDPVTGRFVHQDPIGLLGGENAFAFGPNPMEWFDPVGLLGNRAERRAGEILRRKEAATEGHAHCRHGAQTTMAQQEHRAKTGVPPDNPGKTPQATGPDSTRYLSNVDQLDAIQKGEAAMRASGKNTATVDMGRTIGEGYTAGGGCSFTTKKATTRRNAAGQTYTSYPVQ